MYKVFQSDRNLSSNQHVPHSSKIFSLNNLLNLLFGKPLEILQIQLIIRQIGLASHDPRFHEEDFLPNIFAISVVFGVLVHMVPYRDVADKPGMHIYTSCLTKGTLGALKRRLNDRC